MKTVLFLGAAHTQLPPIRYAMSQGYRVLTCDDRPKNPGHQLADKSFQVSTTDMDGVLAIARSEGIDGIVAYASDPAAPTAAYVAEHLGLPGNPFESVRILAEKDRFRNFLAANRFRVPESASFISPVEAAEWFADRRSAAFVKPVDSSGSKGVSRIQEREQLLPAFEHAKRYSRSGRVIIETEIVRSGYQVAGDGFVVDGELAFRSWADEHFDVECNGLVPIGQTFPTTRDESLQSVAHRETQRLLGLLGMRDGALNFDFIFDENDNFYFLELGPRNGGCRIPEVIKLATGVDMIAATVEAALGNRQEMTQQNVDGFWSSFMIHSLNSGVFDRLEISPRLLTCVIDTDLWVRPGDEVRRYLGSDDTLGAMILRFESGAEMSERLEDMNRDIIVRTK